MKKVLKKNENLIFTTIYILILITAITIRYDLYYDLNDDVLLKDILSGAYTGIPESRNIYMLYPLSAPISLLYRLIPSIPWYALFISACQFLSLFLIAFGSLRFTKKPLNKVLLLSLKALIIIATMLEHLVFIQYTIASAMLAAAAAFCFLTTAKTSEKTTYAFHIIILFFTAFTLRYEMALLALPLICAAALYKWSQEEKIFCKKNFAKYLTLFGLIIITLLIGRGWHMLAYNSAEWKKFIELDSNRTRLYDYYYHHMPEYGDNPAFYNEIGLTSGEVNLLFNYNFGLSEKIDEKIIGEVAEYAAKIQNDNVSFRENFTDKIRLYIYNMTNGSGQGDFPYNSLVILGYTALLGMGLIYNRLGRTILMLIILAGVRSGLWLFILLGGRDPARITHSLYFIEMAILLALFLSEYALIREKKNVPDNEPDNIQKSVTGLIRKSYPPVIAAIALLIAVGSLPAMLKATEDKFSHREMININWIAMQEYCRERPDNFYFIDVYSSVAYSEKLFEKSVKRRNNYDIMGGWASKSPLYQKKLDNMINPQADMFSALVFNENVYFINDIARDPAWLSAYYEEQGLIITMERLDVIADKFEVYKLR